MQYKRLRSGKNIESLTAAKLSRVAKEQLHEAVYAQFIETFKISSEYKEAADGINSMGYVILRTGHDLNEYCEAVAGNAKISPVKTELCGFLSKICENSEKFIKRKGQNLICKIPEEKIFVKIDKERFCYSVLNLILNSAENTPEEGKIRISVSKTKRFVKITVRDNGFGMDEESLIHCFEPFYTKNRSVGKSKMGLGLTLARNFVTESGGRMNVSSEEGKGTAVSMLLPLMNSEEINLSVESPVPDILGGKFSPVPIVLSALSEK